MRPQITDARTSSSDPVLLAAYLTTAQRHAHHFHQPASCEGVGALDGLLKMVDRFLENSAVGGFELRVVHDLRNVSEVILYRGVLLRQQMATTTGVSVALSSDARFRAFERELRWLDADACAFAIDLSDVRLVGRQPLSSLCRRHPSALFVGNDVCEVGKVKRYCACRML
jgi:hypothetical protein